MSTGKNELSTLEVVDTNTENVTTDAPNPTNKRLFSKETFSYVLSREFLIIVLIGQFLSICITATIVTNKELFNRGADFPTTMTLLNYVLIFLIYAPIAIYKRGFKGWWETIKIRWWKYILLSLADVEGNFFVVKAYSYTSILSIMLLDTWTTPCVVLLSIIILKVRYHWSQYLAVLICLLGIGAVIGGDLETGNQGTKEALNAHSNLVLGDIFCILSGTCYAASNVIEEYLIKRRPLYEVLSQMGFFGIIISLIQLLSLNEQKKLAETQWTGAIVGFIIAYNFAMFCLYTVAPLLFRRASATFFNLSLLTSDFYSLIFALILYQAKMHALYPLAFVGTMLGLAIFNIFPAIQPKIEKEDDNEDNEAVKEKDVESNKNN